MRIVIAVLALFLSTSVWAQSGASPDLPGALRLQIGTNTLLNSPSSMDLGIWGSKSFNVHYLYSIRLGESRWSFHPGFGLGTDKFSFDNDVTLQRNGSMVEMVELPLAEFGEINKTKLATTHFEVPFELRFHVNKSDFKKSVKVAVGGKVGILLSSHTKVNFDLDGETTTVKTKDNYELNRFRFGLQGSVGIAGVSVYYYYSLNEFFKSGAGPEGTDANQAQLGISFNLF